MIRKDREITDLLTIKAILDKSDSLCLALNDSNGYPYPLALNYGYEFIEGRLILYFHSALKGKKHELIKNDARAGFNLSCNRELFYSRERGYCTMNYQSVMGRGKIFYIDNPEEKLHALQLLCDRMHPEGHFAFNPQAVQRTIVFGLDVEEFFAKAKQSPLK